MTTRIITRLPTLHYHSFRMPDRLEMIAKKWLNALLGGGLLILLVMSSACGQKGDLYLPDEQDSPDKKQTTSVKSA